jgi:hypothetical protein
MGLFHVHNSFGQNPWAGVSNRVLVFGLKIEDMLNPTESDLLSSPHKLSEQGI